MIKQSVEAISDNLICIEQFINGSAWRFYYQNVDGQWMGYRREKIN